MKKSITLFSLIFIFFSLFSQTNTERLVDNSLPELYVTATVDHSDMMRLLLSRFSVDKVTFDSKKSNYQLLIWLNQKDYSAFDNLNVPFTIVSDYQDRTPRSMATTVAQMENWDKYPTYAVYLQMMQNFQTQFPDLCHIDTILNATPDNHLILAAHLGSSSAAIEGKPAFLYTSSMHGDELTGFCVMLRLIDFMLNNYHINSQVQNIMDHIDIWICPSENPDGTYYSGDDVVGSSPTSTRANANGEDLNRSYPEIGQSTKSLQPEVAAMINFAALHHFTMSANFHGGTELFNFPWDYWTTYENAHADNNWWWYVGRNFADTVHYYGTSSYFYEENNGVTPGADWYYAYGSRQDYMMYYQNCREACIEISSSKTPQSQNLGSFWNYLQHSLFNYMEESLYGMHGVVTDSLTGEPLEAIVFIDGHDKDNSHVYSHLPFGDYHRPILAGNYDVTFAAEGYQSKTVAITITNGMSEIRDVQLVPNHLSVANAEPSYIKLYPNPAHDYFSVDFANEESVISSVRVYNVNGCLVSEQNMNGSLLTFDCSSWSTGAYFVHLCTTDQIVAIKKVMINR